MVDARSAIIRSRHRVAVRPATRRAVPRPSARRAPAPTGAAAAPAPPAVRIRPPAISMAVVDRLGVQRAVRVEAFQQQHVVVRVVFQQPDCAAHRPRRPARRPRPPLRRAARTVSASRAYRRRGGPARRRRHCRTAGHAVRRQRPPSGVARASVGQGGQPVGADGDVLRAELCQERVRNGEHQVNPMGCEARLKRIAGRSVACQMVTGQYAPPSLPGGFPWSTAFVPAVPASPCRAATHASWRRRRPSTSTRCSSILRTRARRWPSRAPARTSWPR